MFFKLIKWLFLAVVAVVVVIVVALFGIFPSQN